MTGAGGGLGASIGDTRELDFSMAGVEEIVGIRGRFGWRAAGAGGGRVGLSMAAVFEAGSGIGGAAWAIGETSPGTDAVLRGRATEGGRGEDADVIAELAGIAVGTGGGFVLGARMGDDFATGSGKWGGAAGDTKIGGVTVELLSGGGEEGADSSDFAAGAGTRSVGDVLASAAANAARLSSASDANGCVGNAGGLVMEGTKGGWGVSGSGTRNIGAAFDSGETAVGKDERGVREVSFKPDEGIFGGTAPEARLMFGRVPVAGRAGGRASWGTGARSAGLSTLPLLTKTRAAGLATITRGGVPGSCPEEEATGPVPIFGRGGGTDSSRAGESEGALLLEGTMPVSGGALEMAKFP